LLLFSSFFFPHSGEVLSATDHWAWVGS
jgi:hypothetical protein